RITLDLGRPALVALDEQTGKHAAEWHRGGVKERDTRNDVFGSLRIGQRLGHGAPASGQARKCDRCPHDLKELTPRSAAGRIARTRHELILREPLELRTPLQFRISSPEAFFRIRFFRLLIDDGQFYHNYTGRTQDVGKCRRTSVLCLSLSTINSGTQNSSSGGECPLHGSG